MAHKKSLPIATADAGPSRAEQRRWEVEDAVRTMQRAEEIKKDKAMMREVKAMARTKMQELKKIC